MIPRTSQLISTLCLLLLETACVTEDENPLNVDNDGDGWSEFEGDCDDGDASLGPADFDKDGDGSISCLGDCDDNDASVESLDRDSDGYSTCDGDCDDNDAIGCVGNPGGGGMILISAGTFDMGCTTAQQADGNCDAGESPVHSVTLTHDFYMGETEVTQGEYQAILGIGESMLSITNPSYFSSCGADCPVESITWHQMAEYANALSALDGLTECFTCTNGSCTTPNSPYTCDGYRLPTEAEWEYAARAGTDYVYAGSNSVGDVGWYSSNANSNTHPVAQKNPNGWGLFDMSGNVWEWTWDWHSSRYYSSSPSSDPEGPTSGSDRVGRGGSWGLGTSDARVADRATDTPDISSNRLGFRLARTAKPY